MTGQPQVDAWQVQSLRLTAFPLVTAPADDQSWWKELTGELPEASTVLARQNARREEGPFHDAKLVNQVQPSRIDWLLTPIFQVEEDDFPSVGPFPRSVEEFVALMLRWLGLTTCPRLKRMAFGTELLLPVDSRASGYRQLASRLPAVQVDPEHSSDFLYQINRPRNSFSVTDLRINRLSKWSVRVGHRVAVVLMGSEETRSERTLGLACHLELDINTDQDRTTKLPAGQLRALLEEMVGMAKEIVERGDIP